jgi:Protein of unknown function (DUF2971)
MKDKAHWARFAEEWIAWARSPGHDAFWRYRRAKGDTDGLLSMWRGYGGNGNGAAIVFDTAKIAAQEDSPIIIANVHYGTGEARKDWLRERVAQFADILARSDIPDDKLHLAAFYFFYRLKLFSIFTKHQGFSEENEWRVVYLRDRDEAKVFDNMFSYWVGPRGVEPKLKLRIEAIPGLSGEQSQSLRIS